MATGPCGVQFRDAFSCFHYSEADPKGSDCYEAFRTMQDCFSLYPTVYNKNGADDDETNKTDPLAGEDLNSLGDVPTPADQPNDLAETKVSESSHTTN